VIFFDGQICLLIGVATLVALAIWIIRDGKENETQERRKLVRRFCVRCGYNVHQNIDRCPECGTPIEA